MNTERARSAVVLDSNLVQAVRYSDVFRALSQLFRASTREICNNVCLQESYLFTVHRYWAM